MKTVAAMKAERARRLDVLVVTGASMPTRVMADVAVSALSLEESASREIDFAGRVCQSAGHPFAVDRVLLAWNAFWLGQRSPRAT